MSLTADLWQRIQDNGSIALNKSLSDWANAEITKLSSGGAIAPAQQRAISATAETDNGVKAQVTSAPAVVPFYMRRSVQIAGGALAIAGIWYLSKRKRR